MPAISANSTAKPATHRTGLEPMWPALARCLIVLIVLIALAAPILATLLSR